MGQDSPFQSFRGTRLHDLLAAQLAEAGSGSGQADLSGLVPLIDAAYRGRDQELEEARATASGLAEELQQAKNDQQRLAAAFEEQTLRFKAALDHMSQGLCFFDADKRLVVSNRRYAEMYGLSPDQIRPGMSLAEIVALRARVGGDPKMGYDEYINWVPSRDSVNSPIGMVVELRNGRSMAIRHWPLSDGGYVATHEDVTERRAVEAKIAHMAHHDALTGLPNRVLFRDRLQRALAGFGRGQQCAVLYLDLDYFKTINDTLGHPLGDALLGAVGERLCRSVRQSDTVARLGGDEFAVVQCDIRGAVNAMHLAERLVCDLRAPFELDGHQVAIGTSIGIALAPMDGTDPDQLMKHADLALYSAKLQGRGRYSFFKPEMAALMEQRRSLELELRLALAAREFRVHYQPLVALSSGRVSGFEALLHWNSPRRGLVSAPEFIELAEEIGLTVPIGQWVLAHACAEAARWPEEVRLSVNISTEQFRSGTLTAAVTSALTSSGLAASRLELEITETAVIHDAAATRAALLELKALGIRIALDDFGTGYSSLSYLREFPFDRIKIDRSFVRDLSRRSDSIAIARAVIALCGSLGLATTAEGVETEEQLAILRAERCDEAQGYLFGRARPASDVAAVLDALSHEARAWTMPETLVAELHG